MPKFSVYAKVTGTKFIGEFTAKNKQEAIEMAEESSNCWVSLCHQCSSECEDPSVSDFIAEKQ